MNTRKNLVDTALQLFYHHGFQATGVDTIAKAAGTTRQTLYYHFESKDQLVVEVIRQRDLSWRRQLCEQIRLRGGDDPLAQLRCIFDVLREYFASPDFVGCLFISAALEFPSSSDPIHKAAKQNFDAVRRIVADLAADSGLTQPETFAAKFNIIVEGAIVAELVDRNQAAAVQAAELANLLIEQYIPERTAHVPSRSNRCSSNEN